MAPDKIRIEETEDPLEGEIQLDRGGFFKSGWLDVIIRKLQPAAEEEEIAADDPIISSGLFEFARADFRDIFRKMLERIFNQFGIPRDSGVDIGSGVTGEMVHKLLPITDEQRAKWIECDVNPKTVELHKQRHPDADMRLGSYLRLRQSLQLQTPITTITGLSSLDATDHVDQALAEIRDALTVGGFLVHMQDVRPGDQYGINAMKKQGHKPPYDVIVGGPVRPGMPPNPYGYAVRKPDGNYTVISSAEFFRRTLGETIQATEGLTLLANKWLRGTGPIQHPEQFTRNFLAIIEHDPHASERTTHAVMTVAQRTN